MTNIEAGKTNLFHSHKFPDKDSYAWTLTTRLGDMLQEAEKLFGKRDYCYTPIGVEFYDGEMPMVWYPGDCKHCKHVAIRLLATAENNCCQALYQLAHETVHLLSPTGGSNANNFEEGVATWFSNYYLKNNGFSDFSLTVESYKRPLKIVKPYLCKDPCLVKIIRKKQPSFHKMTVEDLEPVFPCISKEDLDFLVAKFQR